jgi:hypothetical protein
MADLQVKAVEIDVSTANDINKASMVRIVNTDPANAAVITVRTAGGTVIGSFTLGHDSTNYGCEYLIKNPTDTITSNNETNTGPYVGSGVRAVSVAYR